MFASASRAMTVFRLLAASSFSLACAAFSQTTDPPGTSALTQDGTPDRFGGDWPMYGGNPSHNGGYPATLSRHKFLTSWSVANQGYFGTAIGGGRVFIPRGYTVNDPAGVSAFDQSTGALLWNVSLPPSGMILPPVYHRGRVFVERQKGFNDTDELICLDAATGAVIWRTPLILKYDTFNPPTVDDTGIYLAGGASGGMYRINHDGSLGFFTRLFNSDSWTPLRHQDRLYAWLGETLREYDPVSGAQLKILTTVPPNTQTINDSVGTVAAEGDIAVMCNQWNFAAVNLKDQRLLWTSSGFFSGTPAIKNGIAYVCTTGMVKSYNALTGAPGRSFPTRNSSGQTDTAGIQPIVLDDILIAASDTSTWTFDLTSGSVLQRLTGGGAIAYSDGQLIAVGGDKTVRTWTVNQPAVLTPESTAMAATEDLPFSWDLAVIDPDSDTLTLTYPGLPPWLRAERTATGVHFSGTPLNPNNGPYSFSVTANDSKSFSTTLVIQGMVQAVNDTPTATAPAALAVDEDALLPPLALGGIFSDEEDDITALTVVISDNSNPGLFAAAGISEGSLRLVLTPDANGQATLRLKATDSGGLSVETSLTVTVRPVNDPPVFSGPLPDVSAGPAAAPVVLDFSTLVKDPDAGDTLTWKILSNSNSGLFSKLAFDAQGRLSIEYAPYLSGQSILTVEVTDASGASAQRTFSLDVPVLPNPVLTIDPVMTLNRQTGLQEQRVTLRNAGQRAIGGFELTITGLPADASLYNASGSAAGGFVVGYYQPIAAGESITLVLEYYTPARTTLHPILSAVPALPREASRSTPGSIAIDRAVMLSPGAFLLEFASVPGQFYQIQYSMDGGSSWQDSLVRIRAAGNRVQWIDRGAPRTSSPPSAGKSRFYRVKQLLNP